MKYNFNKFQKGEMVFWNPLTSSNLPLSMSVVSNEDGIIIGEVTLVGKINGLDSKTIIRQELYYKDCLDRCE